MGTYDIVRSPAGEVAQVKCFGCLMTEIHIGEAVALVPRSRLGDDISWHPTPSTFQVALNNGAFLTILDGVLRYWDDARRDGLPLFDSYGVPWSGDPNRAGTVIPPH